MQKNHKSINKLTDAIRARKARKELLALATENANKTADKLSEIDKTQHLSQIAKVGSKLSEIGEKLRQPQKK